MKNYYYFEQLRSLSLKNGLLVFLVATQPKESIMVRVQVYAHKFKGRLSLAHPLPSQFPKAKRQGPLLHLHMLRVESVCVVAPFIFGATTTHNTGFVPPNLMNPTVPHIH